MSLGPVAIEGYGAAPQVILVSFTSIKPELPYDSACVVRPGDHPFLVRDSYIYYRVPRIYPAAEVEQRVKEGVWIAHQACSAALLQKIRNGFRLSDRLPRTYDEILNVLGL
ncbi:MAG TPA: hypothetical protein VF285_02525 [Castellaniella sp.]|uniref:hypothetical protein n=1 Tax=Castellaniella sp. TaxID=1955812 RepID=UPI002F17E4E8